MKFQLLTSLALSSVLDSSSASNVRRLQGEDYYDAVDDTQAVFVKFSEPGCAACEESAPVWEELATAFADNQNIVIAETVCDGENEACLDNNVESYPSYQHGDLLGIMTKYNGPMDLESLEKFTSEHVRLRCTIAEDHWCNDEELLLIDQIRKMPIAEIEEKIELMNDAEEAEYDAAEQKVETAESLLEDAEDKLQNAEGDDELKAAQEEHKDAEKAVADAEAEFDILMDKQEPLELELMEEFVMESES